MTRDHLIELNMQKMEGVGVGVKYHHKKYYSSKYVEIDK